MGIRWSSLAHLLQVVFLAVPGIAAASGGVGAMDTADAIDATQASGRPALPVPPRASDAGAPITASLVANTRSNRQEGALYQAFYDPRTWGGGVIAYRIPRGATAAEPDGLWGRVLLPGSDSPQPQSTATLMDAKGEDWPAERRVLSARTDAQATALGISWEWDALAPEAQQALAGRDADAETLGRQRIAYLRGDRRHEQSAGGIFRNRTSRHGAIVHSRIWWQPGRPAAAYSIENHTGFREAHTGRRAMLYAGANDGMLHGFDAATGEERIAYVPEGLYPRLALLSDPEAERIWTVDGSPLAGDLYLGPPGSADPNRWRSYLAGFPGSGGKGYFVLDVTNPAAFETASPERLVLLDRTAEHGMDPDIGHILAEPVMESDDPALSRQIARLNDGRWALVIGNGYRSRDERAVLLIQYLDGARELFRIVADPTPGGGNGLAPPRLIDADGDGRIDIAYAGDLQGNLWKFDLRSSSRTGWKLAFSGKPLFIARDSSAEARPQPIVSAPVWKAHPQGGLILAFGTGGLPGTATEPVQVQTLYGIHDDAPRMQPDGGQGPLARGRADLLVQSVRLTDGDASGTVSTHTAPATGSGARRGWLLDLPLPSERALGHPEWFEGDLIDLWTEVPGSEGQLRRSFRYTLDIVHGAAPKTQLHAHLPFVAGGQPSRVESPRGPALRSATHEMRLAAPGEPSAPPMQLLGTVTLRPSWRQLQ